MYKLYNTYYNPQNEPSDPSDHVRHFGLEDQDVHGSVKPPRVQWNIEIYWCQSPFTVYKGNTEFIWTMNVFVGIRGRQVPLHSPNPHDLSTLEKDAIRIKVRIPPFADEGPIHQTLTCHGWYSQGLFMEGLRIDGKLTNC